ncbi:MAG: PaaI family thioesterase [Rhizobiales bacterium]|nr:PaaI family thioesterase [Hyphomicrobiales bacterium]
MEKTVKVRADLEFLDRNWDGQGLSALGRLLNIRLVEAGDGTVTFEGIPSRAFYNPQQVVHGGYAATLIDSAMGAAVQSKLGHGVSYGTIELKVNYVRNLTEETGRVTCTAKVVHHGRRLSTAEAKVVDGRGKLIAHGSGTFMVYDR